MNPAAWCGPPHVKLQLSSSVASKTITSLILSLIFGCQALSTTGDKIHRDESELPVLCAVFLTPDCPIANAMAPSLRRIGEFAQASNKKMLLIYPRQGLTSKEIGHHVKAYGLVGQPILDPEHRWVKALNARVTPEAFVFTQTEEGVQVIYQGRVNDLFRGVGNRQEEARNHEFRDAIERVNSGDYMPRSGPPAVGCTIEP